MSSEKIYQCPVCGKVCDPIKGTGLVRCNHSHGGFCVQFPIAHWPAHLVKDKPWKPRTNAEILLAVNEPASDRCKRYAHLCVDARTEDIIRVVEARRDCCVRNTGSYDAITALLNDLRSLP